MFVDKFIWRFHRFLVANGRVSNSGFIIGHHVTAALHIVLARQMIAYGPTSYSCGQYLQLSANQESMYSMATYGAASGFSLWLMTTQPTIIGYLRLLGGQLQAID